MKSKLEYRLYVQRENDFFHEPIKHEQFIYNAIIAGDTEAIKENRRRYANVKGGTKGELSDDALRNSRYHTIINTAVIARICVANGLPHETAYTLSDMYIRAVDKASTEREISRLNDEMTLEYASLMRESRDRKCSKSVRKARDFICNNLHLNITAADAAKAAGYERCYFSTLFKRETGESISGYIRRKRIETAANLLEQTDYSCSEIASALSFSSQSHFTKLFKESYGMTPERFRKKDTPSFGII